MKQIINITLLALILSIPFALSQTRKAIPAGRYEALSGVKTSHTLKNPDNSAFRDSQGFFLAEVAKYIPQEKNGNYFYNLGVIDINFNTFFSGKGVLEEKTYSDKVSILISENLKRDLEKFKKLKRKGMLIVLKDKGELNEVLASLNQFELLTYQADAPNSYFFLKKK